jgi:hypothetical protein
MAVVFIVVRVHLAGSSSTKAAADGRGDRAAHMEAAQAVCRSWNRHPASCVVICSAVHVRLEQHRSLASPASLRRRSERHACQDRHGAEVLQKAGCHDTRHLHGHQFSRGFIVLDSAATPRQAILPESTTTVGLPTSSAPRKATTFSGHPLMMSGRRASWVCLRLS